MWRVCETKSDQSLDQIKIPKSQKQLKIEGQMIE